MKTQSPIKQNEGGLIHGKSADFGKDLDDDRGRAKRVVTQLDFAAWIDGGPIPRPAENNALPREGEVTLHSASTQKSAVVQADSNMAGRRMW
ncbi:hypothetical protein, partial [Staphylococcus sp. GDY8P64P]|uniref:hypothetical protein n=1 Tax=Staphylococcus sp. GDY8P64P TaxID=2804423 RepID=UPI0019528BCB